MKVTDAEIYEHVQDHDDPVLTSAEVADQFGLTRQAAHKRLQRLTDTEWIKKKRIGPSVVWYVD